MKEIFFGSNAMGAFVAWIAWTVIMLSLYKDENEKTWNFKAYVGEHWDNWAASFVCIPVLLWIGYKQLSLGVLDLEKPDWNDLYYLASGFAPEMVKMAYKKWRAKNVSTPPAP